MVDTWNVVKICDICRCRHFHSYNENNAIFAPFLLSFIG